MNILLDESLRLRSGWRFAIYFLGTFIAGSVATAGLAVVAVFVYGQQEAEKIFSSRPGLLLQGILLLVGSFFIGWACAYFFEKLRAGSLGWALHAGWWRDLLLGTGLGLLTLGLAAAIGGVIGGYRPTFTTNTAAALQSLLVSFVIFFIAAAGEEALFRGYGLQTMTRAGLAPLGIALTSLPFAFVHLNNPNVSFGFTFANTILAGIWLGLAYLKTRSLWFALGLHWAWNWSMGALLGIPVSGITQVTPEPLVRLHYSGPNWLHGGSYGLEGGLACSLALAVCIVVIWLARFPRPSAEMLEASPVAESPAETWADPNRHPG